MPARLHIRCEGNGERALLLVHAFPVDGRMWKHQLRDIGAGWRVLAPDLPGFGDSTVPAARMSVDDFASLLIDECNNRGIDGAAVAGCSFGGYIALAMQALQPQFVTHLALVNTRSAGDSTEVRRSRTAMIERLRSSVAGPLLAHPLRRNPARASIFGSMLPRLVSPTTLQTPS